MKISLLKCVNLFATCIIALTAVTSNQTFAANNANVVNFVYAINQATGLDSQFLSTLGDGTPHQIYFNNIFTPSYGILTITGSNGNIPCSVINAKYGSITGNNEPVLAIGDKEHPFYSLEFSPSTQQAVTLKELAYTIVFEPFDKTIPSVEISEDLIIGQQTIHLGDGNFLAWDPTSTDTYPVIHGSTKNRLPSNYELEYSDLILRIVNNYNIPGRLLLYDITSTTEYLSDPNFNLDAIPVNQEWHSDKYIFKNLPENIFGLSSKDKVIAAITPKFDISSPPADGSGDSLKENGKDAFYHTDAAITLSSKTSISFSVPCSGLYTISLQVKSSATTYSHKIYQKDINIYPNTDILNVNWRTVDNPKNFMIPWITANHNWTNAHFDLPNTYGYDTYYSVIGTPYEDDPTFGGVVTPAEKVVDPEDYRVAKIRKADSDLTTIHSVPDNYSKYGVSGIDLTKGKQVSLYFTKNGAVTPEYNLTYVVPDDTVTDVEIFAQDTTEEYFTLQGIPVDASHLSPGIYICKSANQSRKVVVK